MQIKKILFGCALSFLAVTMLIPAAQSVNRSNAATNQTVADGSPIPPSPPKKPVRSTLVADGNPIPPSPPKKPVRPTFES